MLLAGACLLGSAQVQATDFKGNDGSVLLRMCKGADKVKALSFMCHSYLNGYIDAAYYYDKNKLVFCLKEGDKEKVPGVLVTWLDAHPEALTQPSGAVLQKVLTAHFPCKGKR
jgi:hypothetical protein